MELAPNPDSRLRIGCGPDIALQQLQAFIGALQCVEPRRAVEVTHLHGPQQLARLRSGELDLALLHLARDEAGIAAEPLFVGERLAALLPPGHRLASSERLGPGDFADELLIVRPRVVDPALHDRVVASIGDAGYRFRDVREASGGDLRDLLFAVATGSGVALAPPSSLGAAGDVGTIVTRCALDPAPRLPDVAMARRDERPESAGHVGAVARELARLLRG